MTANVTIYAQWVKSPVTYTFTTPYLNSIDVTGYDTITVTIQTCGNDTANGQFYANEYWYLIRVGSASGLSDLGRNYNPGANRGASVTANVSNYSTVYIDASSGGDSSESGAHWTCHSCTVIITLQ